ncbi:unnamed protein product, partial [Candidula unifasciata]
EQQQIVNTNCKVSVFLEFIKAKSGCSATGKNLMAITDIVDVSDQRGHVRNLRWHPKDCARRYLKDRETLIVLQVHNDKSTSSEGNPMTGQAVYTPLLLSLVSNKGFNDALNPHKDETRNVLPSKPRRARSFTFDNDEFRKARSKTRSSGSSSGRKSTARKSRKI